jgi:hypothetical protein
VTTAPAPSQINPDESHLRLLSIFHYVLAAASIVFSSMFLMHFFWGLAVWRGVPFLGQPSENSQDRSFGLVLMAIGAGIFLFGWSLAACLVLAGRSLVQRRRYLFCLILAALICLLCNPLGTVLGVFTIIVLMRPSVKQLFGVQ